MEDRPKSFWQPERELEQDPEKRWITTLDGTPFEQEAQIIRMAAVHGIALPFADGMELWELAAACGVHLVETWGQHNEREVVTKAKAYYEETAEVREAKLAEYQEKRRERERERRQQRREKVT